MNTNRCAVCLVNRPKAPELKFFRFPKDEEMCKKWILASNLKRLLCVSPEVMYKKYRICSKHFEDDAYTDNKRRLKRTACPTKFEFSENSIIISKLQEGVRIKINQSKKSSESVTGADVAEDFPQADMECDGLLVMTSTPKRKPIFTENIPALPAVSCEGSTLDGTTDMHLTVLTPKRKHNFTELAECKNRWASIRDSFPETPEIIRKKRNPKNGELIFTRSIYDPEHVLGNSSDGKNESHLMPLENSAWAEEDYQNFPDQSSSDHDSNVNFPEIKVEVGSYDHEGKPGGTNDPTTERDNCSDYGYIVPNSLCEVVTEPPSTISNKRTSDETDDCSLVVSPQSKKRHDYEYIAPNCIYNTPESQQPTVSNKRTSDESIDEGIHQYKKRREDSETGAIVPSETDNKPPEHPIETFFKSMAATVMTFPPHLMAIAKLNVCKLITELELRALTEKNPFEGSQDRINEMMSENVLASSSAAAENRADS